MVILTLDDVYIIGTSKFQNFKKELRYAQLSLIHISHRS